MIPSSFISWRSYFYATPPRGFGNDGGHFGPPLLGEVAGDGTNLLSITSGTCGSGKEASRESHSSFGNQVVDVPGGVPEMHCLTVFLHPVILDSPVRAIVPVDRRTLPLNPMGTRATARKVDA